MVSITRDFAPPFKLIAPYFIIGIIFYLVSALFLLTFNVNDFQNFSDLKIISWVHLYLLGFVMMIIFGAMAQLIPVVLEKGHFSVDFYYLIYPLLTIGVLLMAYGFMHSHLVLSFGGVLVLVCMSIFALETLLTLKNVKEFNITTISVLLSNTFLWIGVIVGFIMALTFAGFFTSDVSELLKAHVFMVIGGYIFITIMAFSYVLLPMFGLAHGFSRKPLDFAITTQSLGVVSVFIASLMSSDILYILGYILSFISVISYFYLVYLINKTRARKQNDMYIISLFISFVSFALSAIFGVLHVVTNEALYATLSGWLLFSGFFGFIILGHLYKIVPFLVWYERFSPLVGKQKVPMLADMVPQTSANIQISFTCIGVGLISIAMFFQLNYLHVIGSLMFIVGAVIMLYNLLYMIRFK
jgi:hypothetical protein